MTRISSGYSAYSAAAITQLFSSNKVSSQLTQKPQSQAGLLLDKPSQNAVINKIEKHITDVKRGNGDVSKDVSYFLGQQGANASDILSRTNPKALALYSGYLSGLRYDRAARFVNGVEFGVSSLEQVGKKQSES